jgi:hypothetical protein
LDADAFRPAAGAKTWPIQDIPKFYVLPFERLNTQDCELIFYCASSP